MKKIWVFIVVFCVLSCSKQGTLFNNPSASKTGIDFVNTITENDELNILDYLYFYNGGGVAIGDINGDGLADIYFSGNQVKNRLYLNKGNLEFEDISEQAGVEGQSDWNTGAVMADVNGDGLLDIYVCAVVGINGFGGYNELFINNGDLTFTESAQQFGLDFESFSSNAAFFDYDLDGDLDTYLLNHAVHTSESYGKADLRYRRNYETGDKLLRNDDGKFTDVSEAAGIYGGINGYGLGLAVSDFNGDGYPDMYIGNDFHEDDYYYLNNGDGSFTESSKRYFGHTSRFSMGNDVADINHDGLPDLISLDMLPEDEFALKSSEGDDNPQVQKMRVKEFGYHYQFTRNMLYINQPDGNFMETALMSGVAATDWSWSALFADYDLDGHQDLFVANGIPKRPNDLDFIKFVSNDQIQNKINNTKLVDQRALDMIPSGVAHNYIFKGNGQLSFENKSDDWMSKDTLVSGATAYGDLDNDGDLDLVVNNLNHVATIHENRSSPDASYFKVKLNFNDGNPFGIGSKVYAHTNGKLQYKELFTVRGFQASSEPVVHFGLGSSTRIDSLRVVWPNGRTQLLKNIDVNQTLTISYKDTDTYNSPSKSKKTKLFIRDTTRLGIDFSHTEDNYLDFIREKLIPYRISDRGPAYARGDLNGDGRDDLFFGSSKYVSSKTFMQSEEGFDKITMYDMANDSVNENVAASIADFNNDGHNDIALGNGGGDFFGNSKKLTDELFVSASDGLKRTEFPEIYQNTSVLRPFDFDDDGDLDIFVGGQTITGSFGKLPNSVLLVNMGGTYTIKKDFNLSGMVTDALWDDFNGDGKKDLIVVGEWMSPRFFENNGQRLTETYTIDISGLWQRIHAFDIDQDGDTDYLLGNWGLNSKFKASEEFPLQLYFSDFDDNGQTETVTAFEKNGAYYTLEGLDALASQMVSLRKKFTDYRSFAGKSIAEILTPEQLEKAEIHEVTTLASGYLKNNDGVFEFVPFPLELQTSPLLAFVSADFDGDTKIEVLAAGNYFGVKPYHGRFDSFPGALIKSEKEIVLGNELGLELTQKSARHLDVLTKNQNDYLLVVYNNDPLEVYAINSNKN